MTFIVDPEITSVKMDISARILYRDVSLFESVYPIHITLPFRREISCTKECVFSDIPAGDAQATFVSKTGAQFREQISIV